MDIPKTVNSDSEACSSTEDGETGGIEGQAVDTLMDCVEEQQRWIKVLSDRSGALLLESIEGKNQDAAFLAEFSKLEASVSVSSNLSRELGDLSKRSAQEHVVETQRLERALESVQEELMECQGDRVRAEVEFQRQRRTLEESFEKLVSEKDGDLSALQRTHIATIQENEALKQQLELERTLNRGLQARTRTDASAKSSSDALIGPVLDALWQVTSDEKPAFSVLQGSSRLLELIGDALRMFSSSIVSTSSKLGSRFPSEETIDHNKLHLIPALCGILVNMAAISEGRKALAETWRGGLLLTILQLVDNIRNINTSSNNSNRTTDDSNAERFNRNATRLGNEGGVAPVNIGEITSDIKHLLLCIISNLCAERTIAIQLIKAGLVEKMVGLVRAEQSEPLRRYAVNIVRSTLEFVQNIGSRVQNGAKAKSQTQLEDQKRMLSPDDVYAQIGDLITLLSKESSMKMIGLELLGELQRVMPMED